MKTLVLLVVLAAAIALTGPSFAEDVTKATTREDCDKAGGAWNAQSSECAEESAKMGKEEGTHEGAPVGTSTEDASKKLEQPER